MCQHKPFRSVWAFFLSITIPAVILLLFLHLSSIRALEKSHREIIAGNQRMILSSVERADRQISKAAQDCVYTMDFVTFCDSRTPAKVNRYAGTLSGKLRYSLDDFSEVAGYVLYNSVCERIYYTDFSVGDSAIYTGLSFGDSLRAGERIYENGVLEYGGKVYLTRSWAQRHGTLVILLDPEQNEFFQAYQETSDESQKLAFRIPAAGERDAGGTVCQASDTLPLELTMTGAFPAVWLRPRQIMIFALILLLIGLILLVGKLMQTQLIAPLGLLWNAFSRISQGETEYRIQENTRFPEINDFYHGFNQMLDRLREARSQRDQSMLDSAHARLQYFQLQIRPHFYLNCLKNIRAMASLHEDEKIQEMVILMSGYLRYIFQDNRKFIPLREELDAVQGYVDLLRIMGSPIELLCDIQADGLEDPVLPLTVLTFVENSIKHSRNQKTLSIRISIRSQTREGKTMQCITIRDDGAGFAPETLAELNDADPRELRYRKYHIGIANVRYRLWLVYGEEAWVAFRNEADNAVVELCFPPQPVCETPSFPRNKEENL